MTDLNSSKVEWNDAEVGLLKLALEKLDLAQRLIGNVIENERLGGRPCDRFGNSMSPAVEALQTAAGALLACQRASE